MKLFHPSYINLFRELNHIDSQSCLNLLLKIGFRKNGSVYSIDDVAQIVGVSTYVAQELVEKMIGLELFGPTDASCPECDSEFEYSAEIFNDDSVKCSECGSRIPIKHLTLFELKAGQDPSYYSERVKQSIHSVNAEFLAEFWQKQNHIYYLIIDLVDSEHLQQNQSAYGSLLETFREKVFPTVLGPSQGQYLLLGEVGDLFKIAFFNIEAMYSTVNRLHAQLIQRRLRIETLEGDNNPIRFKVIMGKIGRPETELRKKTESRDLLHKTLNDTWDINHPDVTKLFRVEGKLRSPHEIDEYLLSVTAVDEVIGELRQLDSIWNETPIEREIQKSDNHIKSFVQVLRFLFRLALNDKTLSMDFD